MKFSDKLRMMIEEREITQKRMAAELKIPASTLGGYVQGTSEPDFDTLILLARYFDVSTDFLLDHSGDPAISTKEIDMLRIFRSLTPEEQEIYLEQGKAFLRIKSKQ